ncbi:MAG: glycosyltransferase family 2 protein [Terracidiphilus sp.]|nr:glycosyltransferase family 2 protein [Terracidiphilus sp.]
MTIAIPTYNRAGFLSSLLESLREQIAEYEDVELLISDNASTDSTPEIIKNYIDKKMEANVFRNADNIGADRNFISLFNAAKGKYFWLIGDDERLLPYTLERLMPLLRSGDHDMLYINSYGYTVDGVEVKVPNISKTPIIYTDPVKYATAVGSQFTFISANIINRDRILEDGLIDFQAGIGSLMIQLYWIYPSLNVMRSAVFVRDTLIITRSYQSTGWGVCKIMGINAVDITRKLVKSPDVVNALENKILYSSLPSNIIRMKSPGYVQDRESPHKTLCKYWGRDCRYWFCVFPISILPLWPAKAWWFVVRCINKINNTMHGR